MITLPDEALVVRGGQNLPENFASGSGVSEIEGKIYDVSVNSAAEISLAELTAPNRQTGYPGIPHNRVGVTTAGKVRALGGNVTAKPSRNNPYHATLYGLTPVQASELFRPTVKNPSHRR